MSTPVKIQNHELALEDISSITRLVSTINLRLKSQPEEPLVVNFDTVARAKAEYDRIEELLYPSDFVPRMINE